MTPLEIHVLSDGKPGHENQSLGLAEAIEVLRAAGGDIAERQQVGVGHSRAGEGKSLGENAWKKNWQRFLSISKRCKEGGTKAIKS
jgi:hypothetical protein